MGLGIEPYIGGVSNKSDHIAKLIEEFRGQDLDAHYLSYFACFNRQLFYEAHEVLEELWLGERHGPSGAFYKGLIQLTAAFVHLQKDRPGPSAALFKLARANLQSYPPRHERLDVANVVHLIEDWLSRLEATGFAANPLTSGHAPKLSLIP